MSKRQFLGVLLVAASGIGAVGWLNDRHHFSVRWPAKVQKETVGATLVTADMLVSSERHFSQSGEGFARWTYKIDAPSPALQELCGMADVTKCSFSRRHTVEEGVDLFVGFSGDKLTVEEWWS